jgi:carbonic anhydrase/acetyltransferase-like protein (isoleucine patch superfamily)
MLRPYKGVMPKISFGCYIDESAQIIGDVTLAENVSVWMNAVVRGDVHHIKIGANSNIQDCSVLHGMLGKWPVELGEWVTVGHSVTIHGCVIGNRCLIGMGVVVLNGARIGDDCIIAAGTLIPEGTVITSGSLVMGVPGKVKRKLTDIEIASIMTYGRNYIGYKDQYIQETGSDNK